MQRCSENGIFKYKGNQPVGNARVNLCVDDCDAGQVFYHDDSRDDDNPLAYKCASVCPQNKPYFDASSGCVARCESEIWQEVSGKKQCIGQKGDHATCKKNGYRHYYQNDKGDYVCISASCQTADIGKPFADRTTGECLG